MAEPARIEVLSLSKLSFTGVRFLNKEKPLFVSRVDLWIENRGSLVLHIYDGDLKELDVIQWQNPGMQEFHFFVIPRKLEKKKCHFALDNGNLREAVVVSKVILMGIPADSVPDPNDETPRVCMLQGIPQHYAWGRPATSSAVTPFLSPSRRKELLAAGAPVTPCAEIWMGTHPKGMAQCILDPVIPNRKGSTSSSSVKVNHVDPELIPLSNWLRDKDPDHSGTLPFLLKILSINTALSIQAHPDKEHAHELHRDRPDLYADPNHKPELACALSPFMALCQFRHASEIATALRTVPELANIVGESATKFAAIYSSPSEPVAGGTPEQRAALKAVFSALMQAPPDKVAKQARALARRSAEAKRNLPSPLQPGSIQEAEQVAGLLLSQYPDDVGAFCAFLMNIVTLKPGEALFLGPNEPHAYISGDCVECMATSDNVVRAGLTPKHRDVPTLLKMLTYAMAPANVLQGENPHSQKGIRLYEPYPPDDFPEFRLYRVVWDPQGGSDAIPDLSMTGLIVLVTRGSVKLEAIPQSRKFNTFPVASYQVSEGQSCVIDGCHQLKMSSHGPLELFICCSKAGYREESPP